VACIFIEAEGVLAVTVAVSVAVRVRGDDYRGTGSCIRRDGVVDGRSTAAGRRSGRMLSPSTPCSAAAPGSAKRDD
jgi:hypothetical protein